MSFATLQSARSLTAPGYFDFSSNQSDYNKKIFKWFDSAMQVWVDQQNKMDSFFRLWQTYNYSSTTITRTPYVQYKLNQWGLGWFKGTDQQAVSIVSLVSRGYSNLASQNFLYLFDALSKYPFFWCIAPVQIIYEPQFPAVSAETLIIFSDSVSLPATPSPQAYIERAWSAPSGWSMGASSSTWFSRGYLSGGNIVWMTPQSTSTVYPFYDVALLADLPVSPDIGSLGGVKTDGTGDVGAVYYFDGSIWRKTTTPNPNQGTVEFGIPDPNPRAVASPNPDNAPKPISSNIQPPVSGPSQGYGMYGGLSQTLLQANEISLSIVLTASGVDNIGIIVNLLRRIKPTLNLLTLFYTLQGSSNPAIQVSIKDARSL